MKNNPGNYGILLEMVIAMKIVFFIAVRCAVTLFDYVMNSDWDTAMSGGRGDWQIFTRTAGMQPGEMPRGLPTAYWRSSWVCKQQTYGCLKLRFFFSICNLFLHHFRVFLFPHLNVCVQSICAEIVARAGWGSRIRVTSCLKTARPGRRAGRNARGREEILPSSLMNVCRSVNVELWSN